MGIRLVVEVLDSPADLTAREKLALIAIAESASDDTRCGWPGRDVVARRARIGERSVARVIAGLVERGHLERVGGGFRGRRAEYRLPVKGDIAVSPFTGRKGGHSYDTLSEERVSSRTRKGVIPAQKGDTAMSPLPSIPSENPHHPRARADEIAAVVEALAERTGKTITEDHAALVVAQLVGNRTGIRDRCRYLTGAIRRDDNPERFLPTPGPPRYRREDRPA